MTLVTPKFEYRKLSRIETDGRRLYDWGGGDPVASVTTILDSTKDKTHLIEWRKRMGEQRATQITTEAAARGTRMHNYLENYVKTGVWPEPGSNPYAQHSHRMASIIREQALAHVDEFWGTEVSLFMPHMYAGTTDLVGTYRGQPAIMDYKQSNGPKKAEWIEDYFLQTVFYGTAHNEVYGTDIRESHIFMCTKDLEYLQFDIWPDQWAGWQDRMWSRLEQYYSQFG
jgi:hypothetical protein